MKAVVRVAVLASLMASVAVALTNSVAPAQEGGPTDKKASVWSGIYTAAQSKRGETFYSSACAHCHGLRLNGAAQPDQPPSPAIARVGFLRKWSGQTVATLFTYVRHKMPPDNPGAYNDQDSIDAVAHMFAVSNIPAGDKELPSDLSALDTIFIAEQPKK